MFNIDLLVSNLLSIVKNIIVFIFVILVIIAPLFRLIIGFLKDWFTPKSKIYHKIHINNRSLTLKQTYEISEQKLLNYIKNNLAQGKCVYFEGGSKLVVSACFKNNKPLVDKIFKWDQITYTIQFKSII